MEPKFERDDGRILSGIQSLSTLLRRERENKKEVDGWQKILDNREYSVERRDSDRWDSHSLVDPKKSTGNDQSSAPNRGRDVPALYEI